MKEEYFTICTKCRTEKANGLHYTAFGGWECLCAKCAAKNPVQAFKPLGTRELSNLASARSRGEKKRK